MRRGGGEEEEEVRRRGGEEGRRRRGEYVSGKINQRAEDKRIGIP